jgi:predicted N-acetyltransferase YhbS
MGKNFPQITNLGQKPHLKASALALIEKSFEYRPENSFQNDFAPLIDTANHQHCYILIDETEQVLAHLGVKERQLRVGESHHTVCFLGGIAVAPEHRGQGLLQLMMQEVLSEHQQDVSAFFLWSNLDKLYAKYGFFQCGGQYESPLTTGGLEFEKTKFHDLAANDQQAVQSLYEKSFASFYSTCIRTEADWQQIKKITSADLFIRREDAHICDYFFMNKGQDLPGIIYEYGSSKLDTDFLRGLGSFGKVWSGRPIDETQSAYYQFLLAPGSRQLFGELVKDLTQGRVQLREINRMKQEAYFEFNDELLALPLSEFLSGIFGPTPFEELDDLRTIFISGLDSI